MAVVLQGFTKSERADKKYTAILFNTRTGRTKKVHFGGIKKDGTPYQQYHDRIGLYNEYDHWDEKRRDRYYKRHGKKTILFSPKYFSHKYLW